jgi:hypothetical protein
MIAGGNRASGASHPPFACHKKYKSEHSITQMNSTTYVDITRVPRVLDEDDVGQSENEANENAEERKSADTGRPASFLLEDDREGGEQHLRGRVRAYWH